MTVTLKETFFRTVAMVVVSMQVCWGSDPPKSYGPSPPKDYYQNNYEPDIQRPLALFTEKPVNVASLVLIPVVQVPSADLKIIYKPQIDSVSKTEPIIMCKSSTKSFEATPAVLVPLQQPFYLYDERTLIPFPKTVTILHGGYRMSIPVGMVVAPIPVGVLKSGPVLVNTLYAIPASPVLVPSTIRFVPVPSYPSPPSYSPPSPPSYSPPSPPSYSPPSPPSYSHPAPSPPSYSHPAPSPPSYSHPPPPSYSHPAPSPPSYSHPSPPSYPHPSPPAAYPHPAPSPPAYSPPSSSSPAYSHPSPPPVYSHPSPPPVYSHPSPPPVYSHPSPPTPPPKYSLPAPPEPTYYQHAGDYGGDSAPKYGKLYSQYTADPPPPPFYNSKESPLLHQLREEAEKNRHNFYMNRIRGRWIVNFSEIQCDVAGS